MKSYNASHYQLQGQSEHRPSTSCCPAESGVRQGRAEGGRAGQKRIEQKRAGQSRRERDRAGESKARADLTRPGRQSVVLVVVIAINNTFCVRIQL